MTRITLISVFLSASVISSCAAVKQPSFQLRDLEEQQLFNGAEVIVIGTTKYVHWENQRTNVQSARQSGVESARLVRVGLGVENIIKGNLSDREIDVTYWAADVFTNARSLSLPVLGERAIHYLRVDQGQYRYVTDIVRSKTVVLSGTHVGFRKSGNEADEMLLAKILLTPGDGINADFFGRHLSDQVIPSLELTGYGGTLSLVKALLKHPNSEVKCSACVQLHTFIGQDDCLDRPELLELVYSRRQELRTLLQSRSQGQAAFAKSFLSNPGKAAKQYAVLPGRAGIVDFLGLIAQHPDPRLANRAVIELKQLNQ